ncbi:MAG: glycosyltransferase [Flavicella sp.]|nr:glycosyltransferase [Flavicella sp.]MDG1805560.1 glycosyltransferase [Flavicella sp.]
MLDYLWITFYVIIFLQCLYYLIFLTPLLGAKQNNNRNRNPISVVVCAKNEAQNLKKFIPHFLQQKYSAPFEIVLINDRSTDETGEIISQFAQNNSNIKIVNVEECENFWGNKKYALTLGIKAAQYEHLLFTDADCYPTSENWIEQMASCFSKKKSIVLGYGGYEKIKNSFLNKLIRYETVLTALQYFSYSKAGIPYMGVGRNLAYTKSEFFKVNGFIKHIKIKSGDDDLFINEIADSSNTSINLSFDSTTTSIPKNSFKDWILQKRRHISTASHYKAHHKILLATFYLTQIITLIAPFVLLFFTADVKFILIPLFIRYAILFLSFGLFSKKLKEMDLILWIPFLEISLIFIQLYLYLINRISIPTNWK